MEIDWNKLLANERNALVAEAVMGKKIYTDQFFRGGTTKETVRHLGIEGDTMRHIQPYSWDISSAWQVIEKMRENGWEVDIDSRANKRWFCRFMSDGPDRDATADAAPEAICLAALRALGVNI